MKAVTSLILAAGLATAVTANANEVSSAGGAMALCKAEAQAAHSDYVSSKSKRIKQNRKGYQIKMRVRLADKSINANCNVAKDGTVAYGV